MEPNSNPNKYITTNTLSTTKDHWGREFWEYFPSLESYDFVQWHAKQTNKQNLLLILSFGKYPTGEKKRIYLLWLTKKINGIDTQKTELTCSW